MQKGRAKTPWEALAARLLARWKREGLIAVSARGGRKLPSQLADWLAAHAGDASAPAQLGGWLVEQDAVEDVFGGDEDLAAVFEEEARAVRVIEPDRATIVAGAERSLAAEAERRIDALAARLQSRYGRRAFHPVLEPGGGARRASKFRGAGLLERGEGWPTCGNCGKAMPLFIQLDLGALPPTFTHPHRTGLVQLFYCTNSDPSCRGNVPAWEPGARSTFARWLPAPAHAIEIAGNGGGGVAHGRPGDNNRNDDDSDNDDGNDGDGIAPIIELVPRSPWPSEHLQPSHVVGWTEQPSELPAYQEPNARVTEHWWSEQLDDWAALGDRGLVARAGDKLGGWPAWVQSPRYPPCPACRKPMLYLFQLESNGACGYQFGDLGAGHLFQCADHAQHVAFGWACH